jgi:hypothetical protein
MNGYNDHNTEKRLVLEALAAVIKKRYANKQSCKTIRVTGVPLFYE